MDEVRGGRGIDFNCGRTVNACTVGNCCFNGILLPVNNKHDAAAIVIVSTTSSLPRVVAFALEEKCRIRITLRRSYIRY